MRSLHYLGDPLLVGGAVRISSGAGHHLRVRGGGAAAMAAALRILEQLGVQLPLSLAACQRLKRRRTANSRSAACAPTKITASIAKTSDVRLAG